MASELVDRAVPDKADTGAESAAREITEAGKDKEGKNGSSPVSKDKSSSSPNSANTTPNPPERSSPTRGRWPWLLAIGVIVAGIATGVGFLMAWEKERDDRLTLQGNIDVRQVNLAFKVDGRIETLFVDEGDSVKAGQILATLEKRYFEDDLSVVQARRDNAAATLARLENGSRPEEIAQAKAQLSGSRKRRCS